MTPEFVAFPKLARLRRNITITEKIDGTNAAIGIGEDGSVWAQSRKRLITPGDDNFGFARWVTEHADELLGLGEGLHFGEWWGSGIGRRYGLDEKRFSLFNTSRWTNAEDRPACCHVVPVLAQHTFSGDVVENAMVALREHGSVAVPGFMRPEGVVVFHHHANVMFKATLEGDEMSKGEALARGLAA